MKALLLVLFFGAAACFLWFSLLCLRMIEYDNGKKKKHKESNLSSLNRLLIDAEEGHFLHQALFNTLYKRNFAARCA